MTKREGMLAAVAMVLLGMWGWQVWTGQIEQHQPIALWPDGAPGALGKNAIDIPTLVAYVPNPSRKSGAVLVLCPGGGYQVMDNHSGRGFAQWLAGEGVTCFVLKYRLGSDGYRYPVPMLDAARAVRWVRAHAKEYGVDPQRVGIMGSSAGGHVAAMLMTHFDAGNMQATDPVERESSRPDLGVLCVPVISMEEFANEGTKQNLLGDNPSLEKLHETSADRYVTRGTPPCFIWTTNGDTAVPMENSLKFVEALRRNGVPLELHVYEQGYHGMGLGVNRFCVGMHPWTQACLFWLKTRGWVR